MPSRGRQRRSNLTTLPAGTRVLTGKSRSGEKNAIYSAPLPISVDNGLAGAAEDRRKSQSSWGSYIRRLCGLGDANREARATRPEVARAFYDATTRSFYVEIESSDGEEQPMVSTSASVRLLWECGFFGKGSLSRSEPTWASRGLHARAVQRQRERGVKIFTPEELTSLRRKERRAAKIERARLAVRAGQQLADGIVALGGELNDDDELAIAQQVQHDLEEQRGQELSRNESEYGRHIPGLVYLKPKAEKGPSIGQSQGKPSAETEASLEEPAEEDDVLNFRDMESLQLSFEEVFFLSAILGVLEVVNSEGEVLDSARLYALLTSLALPTGAQRQALTDPPATALDASQVNPIRPDNPFLLQYVAYHYFRSQGWVVRTGTKFCVDWLLYKRGPAFSHAEFAVVVLPTAEDGQDDQGLGCHDRTRSKARDWIWFSSTNRVNTQVLKTLVLCYVIVPPLTEANGCYFSSAEGFIAGLQSGSTYQVHTKTVRRFTPQRMRA